MQVEFFPESNLVIGERLSASMAAAFVLKLDGDKCLFALSMQEGKNLLQEANALVGAPCESVAHFPAIANGLNVDVVFSSDLGNELDCLDFSELDGNEKGVSSGSVSAVRLSFADVDTSFSIEDSSQIRGITITHNSDYAPKQSTKSRRFNDYPLWGVEPSGSKCTAPFGAMI